MRRLQDEQAWLMTTSLVILATVAIAFALAYTRTVMIPFVLAVFVTYLVSPLVELLEGRLRVPRTASIVLALLVVFALLALLFFLFTMATRRLVDNADLYRERLIYLAQQAFAQLDRYGFQAGQRTVLDALQEFPLLGMITQTAGTVVSWLTRSVLIVIFVIFLLAGRRPALARDGVMAEVDAKIRHYLLTKFTISALTGVLVGTVLTLFGLDLAVVFGFLAFLLNFIPSLGSVISTVLPIPVAVVQFDSPWVIVAVVAIPGLIQMILGNGIEPKLMGEGLDLHPVTVLVALVFWGLLWGPIGMLLAAPMTAVLRILFARFETTRPFASLLSGHLPMSEAT